MRLIFLVLLGFFSLGACLKSCAGNGYYYNGACYPDGCPSNAFLKDGLCLGKTKSQFLSQFYFISQVVLTYVQPAPQKQIASHVDPAGNSLKDVGAIKINGLTLQSFMLQRLEFLRLLSSFSYFSVAFLIAKRYCVDLGNKRGCVPFILIMNCKIHNFYGEFEFIGFQKICFCVFLNEQDRRSQPQQLLSRFLNV